MSVGKHPVVAHTQSPSQADPVVVVDGLRVRTATGAVLVDDLSFTLPRGGSLGLVGESGSGKSLSALSIMRLLPATLTADGRRSVNGRDVGSMSLAELRRMRGSELGMVFQDPFTALNPVFTVRSQLAAVIRAHDPSVGRKAVEARAVEALADMGLKEPARFLDRYPFQLSGGQAQRVAIAIALIPDPDVLIADEPTTALDVTVQDGILRLLERLRESRQLSLIFISHDLAVVVRLCESLCIMQGGHVVEQGATRDVIANPRSDYTKALLAAVPDFSPATRQVPGSATTGRA